MARPPEYAVLHAPKLESLAQDIASQLEGTVPVLCTSGLLPTSQTGLGWDTFPSGDPNIKVLGAHAWRRLNVHV